MHLCSVRTLRKDLKEILDHTTPTLIGDNSSTRAIVLPMPGDGHYGQPITRKAVATAQRVINAYLADLRAIARNT